MATEVAELRQQTGISKRRAMKEQHGDGGEGRGAKAADKERTT